VLSRGPRLAGPPAGLGQAVTVAGLTATVTPTGSRCSRPLPSHGPVGRVVQLTGIDLCVPVYPTLQLARDGGPPSAR